MRFCYLLLLFITHFSFAQNTEIVYRSKNDSTQNYYYVQTPDSASKGLLVMIPGFCSTPDDVLGETNLATIATQNRYTVVIPYLVNCDSIDINNNTQKRLETLIPELIKKYNIPINKFIIGGHSLGGHQALFYAETAFKKNNDQIIKPNAVFGVDPPLNLKRIYGSFERNVRINFSEVSVAEGKEQIRRFKILYGGTPAQKPKNYENASSFYADAIDGGNAKYLKTIPVRLYCDPDIQWIIENRRGSFEHMNAADLSGCISQLKILGNTKAELITALGKGYWSNGKRHPHALSIFDTNEFITWVNKVLY